MATKSKGHASHTQASEGTGLPGKMRRPIKITMLGAGSGFTPRVFNDIVKIPSQLGGTVALVDIDGSRLTMMTKLLKKLLAQMGRADWTVIASRDRKQVLAGSDYIINC